MATTLTVSLLWLTMHLDKISPELKFDYLNEASNPGSAYYPLLLLFDYRGLPLVLLLSLLLVREWRREKSAGRDLWLAAWLIVPLLFYLSLATKRAWYPLPAYPALALWVAATAARQWDAKPVRNLCLAATAIYGLLAAANMGVVLAQSFHPSEGGHRELDRPPCAATVHRDGGMGCRSGGAQPA